MFLMSSKKKNLRAIFRKKRKTIKAVSQNLVKRMISDLIQSVLLLQKSSEQMKSCVPSVKPSNLPTYSK